jgi:hypothetical protein
VHGFRLLSAAHPPATRELALAAASVSADVGILLASVSGLFIQVRSDRSVFVFTQVRSG